MSAIFYNYHNMQIINISLLILLLISYIMTLIVVLKYSKLKINPEKLPFKRPVKLRKYQMYDYTLLSRWQRFAAVTLVPGTLMTIFRIKNTYKYNEVIVKNLKTDLIIVLIAFISIIVAIIYSTIKLLEYKKYCKIDNDK